MQLVHDGRKWACVVSAQLHVHEHKHEWGVVHECEIALLRAHVKLLRTHVKLLRAHVKGISNSYYVLM